MKEKLKEDAVLFAVVIHVFGWLFLGYSVYKMDIVQNNPSVKVVQYELLAKKFPPSSENHKRLKAMAEAVRQGKTEYTYTTDSLPAAMVNKDAQEELKKKVESLEQNEESANN